MSDLSPARPQPDPRRVVAGGSSAAYHPLTMRLFIGSGVLVLGFALLSPLLGPAALPLAVLAALGTTLGLSHPFISHDGWRAIGAATVVLSGLVVWVS